MQTMTILRALKTVGSWEAAVAAGRQEIAHRDSLLPSDATSLEAWLTNRRINRALAGFANPAFWAESPTGCELSAAFALWESLRAVYYLEPAIPARDQSLN